MDHNRCNERNEIIIWAQICGVAVIAFTNLQSSIGWTPFQIRTQMKLLYFPNNHIFRHLFLPLVQEIFILGKWMLQYKWWWWCWDYCWGTAGLDLESGQSMLMQSQHPRPNTALAVTPRKRRYKNTEASVKSTEATSDWIIFLQSVYLQQYWDERCMVDKTRLFKYNSPHNASVFECITAKD